VESNKYIHLNYGYLPIILKESLTEVTKASICFITKNRGTGFFIKLPIPSKERPMYGLMTNNHVLDSKCIKLGNSFSIKVNDVEKEIILNENDFIFTSELIDVTFIQLNEKNINDIKSNNPFFKFLNPNFNNCTKYNDIELNDPYFKSYDPNFDNIPKYNDVKLNDPYFKSYDPNFDNIPKYNDIKLNDPYFKFHDDSNLNNNPENNDVYIFQYPKGELSYASGKIQSISGFNYFHTASTDGGSSGSPLLNRNMEVIGIHKAGMKEERMNLATKFNVIDYAIRTLYNKSYINSIDKAREPTRKLSEKEEQELNKHGLKETKIPNMYKCPYKNDSSSVLYFYRTNHAWYYITKSKNEKINYRNFKYCKWNLINVYEPIEEIIRPSEKKLEHRHELIIMWLKLSELMYM